MKLSRIDRIQRVLTVATLFPQLDPASVTSISVGLLAPRDTPTAATTWTANSVTAGAATVLFVGSDADSTGAVVVTATADLWAKASGSFGEVEAVLVERITLMGSAAQIAAPLPIPPVLTVQGRTGAVVLSAADVGAVPRWKASTAYAAGDLVINPTGQTVTANATFTSGASYNATNWTIVAGGVANLLLSDTRPSSPTTGLVRIGLAVDTTAPSTPTGLAVTPGNTQNALSWTASTDNVAVTGYKVRRGGTLIASPTSTSYTDTGLTNGTSYSYTVSAVDAAGNESAQSSSVSGTPATVPGAPTGLSATAGNLSAALTWTAPASNGGAAVTDYIVQYRTTAGPGSWTTFADGTSTTASATVTGLTNGTGYDFQVAAVNTVGTGTYSATASATPTSGADVTPPTAPTSLAAGTPTSTTIPLTWTASTDNVAVVAYDVYNSGSLLQSGLTGTSGTVTGLTASTAYVLTLKARDAAGNVSTASNSVSVSTTAGSGTAPDGVTGLGTWYKADTLGLADGAAVSAWASSQAGTTNSNLVQATGTLQPTFHTAVQNGLPVVRFDGVDDTMQTVAQSPVITTTQSGFVVGRFITAATNASLVDGAGAANTMRLYLNSTTSVQFFAGGGASFTASGITSWHVFGFRHNATTASGMDLWIDGTKVATGTGGSTAASGIRVGSSNATGYGNADIGEIAIYPATLLADADMLAVTRSLGAKWGVTVA